MRTYELFFIVQPDLDEEGLAALTERITQVMTDNGGEVVKAVQMGRRELTYPVKRRTAGYYVLIHAKLEQTAIRELDRALKLSEDVLRHMMVRLDEVQPVGEPS